MQRPAAITAPPACPAGLTITPSEAFTGRRSRVFPFTCRVEEGSRVEVTSIRGIAGS